MSSDLIPIGPEQLGMLRQAFDQGRLAKPFQQDILLLECHVAGTSYRDLEDVEPQLSSGMILRLRRDPENPHDPLAIAIYDEAGAHLGFIPRIKNEVLARLLDAGKWLFARLEAKQWQGEWLKLDVSVIMRDF